MDRIAIKDLRIYAYHGVRDFEKERGQLFILDVDIFADLSEACRTDNLEATINYSQATQSIKRRQRQMCIRDRCYDRKPIRFNRNGGTDCCRLYTCGI